MLPHALLNQYFTAFNVVHQILVDNLDNDRFTPISDACLQVEMKINDQVSLIMAEIIAGTPPPKDNHNG
jgi:hypothetical protein